MNETQKPGFTKQPKNDDQNIIHIIQLKPENDLVWFQMQYHERSIK